MKKTTIHISYEEEKLAALNMYLTQKNEEVHCGGFLCRLFDQNDLSCSNCLREFDLGVGFEIPDASDESLRNGVCSYISDHSADLHGESSLAEPDAAITFGPQM